MRPSSALRRTPRSGCGIPFRSVFLVSNQPLRVMDHELPDYYRDLVDSDEKSDATTDPETNASASVGNETPLMPYRADAFQLPSLGSDWQDRSDYTIAGPTLNGFTHHITIETEHDIETDSVHDFATQQTALLADRLDTCRILIDEPIELDCGHPSHRVICVWHPEADQRRYQEQLFVLQNGRGYTLAATFTPATRKQIGEAVERIMLSFTPTDLIRSD